MNEEHRSNQTAFIKTPIGGCCLLTVIGLPLIVVIVIGLVILSSPWRHEQYIKANLPLVQEAVQNQCSINNYENTGQFDDFGVYYDDFSEWRIYCELKYNSEAWRCTCTERD